MAEMAVIKTGGKQYIVASGKKLKIEKLPQKEGGDVIFDEVLLVENDKGITIGSPLVEGAVVKGKVLSQGKAKKVIVFKFKAKKREKTKNGHRQPYSEVEITSIEEK
jgi:large subunit ribosomal protein L21